MAEASFDVCTARSARCEVWSKDSIKPAAVERIPSRPNFVVTEFDEQMPAVANDGARDSVEAANFRHPGLSLSRQCPLADHTRLYCKILLGEPVAETKAAPLQDR